MLSILRRNDC